MLFIAFFIAAADLATDVTGNDPVSAAASHAHAHSHTHAKPEIDETQGPVLIELTYTGETMSNMSGGLRRGTRYLDNLDLVLEADLDALAGWHGAELHAYGLYNNGKSISALVGDSQAVSNIETGTRALRLYEAWIDQRITPELSIRAGLYDLNSEFDALEASGLFIGSPHGIGTDFAQTGLNGPSIFPSTSLAARIELKPAKGWILRAAVLDAVPGNPNHPGRTAIRLGSGDGALLIGEADVALGGHLLLGHWRYTASFETFDGRRADGNSGMYLRGETPLFQGNGRHIDGFFRVGTARGRFNMFNRFASTGLKLSGWIPGRGDDEMGVAIATAFTSPDYRLETNSGKSETLIEATYRAKLNAWLSLQPSVQYVRRPSADPAVADAIVFGLRAETSFRLTK